MNLSNLALTSNICLTILILNYSACFLNNFLIYFSLRNSIVVNRFHEWRFRIVFLRCEIEQSLSGSILIYPSLLTQSEVIVFFWEMTRISSLTGMILWPTTPLDVSFVYIFVCANPFFRCCFSQPLTVIFRNLCDKLVECFLIFWIFIVT